VETYPELTFPDEITVEFFAELGDEDDLTIINFPGEQSGFSITNPRALKVQYVIEGDLPGLTESIELTTTINLSDYTTGSGADEEYFAVGWKHVAWTYEKATGISRLFENGVPAYITHVNGAGQPGEFFYDGIDGRGLVMPGMLDQDGQPTQLIVGQGIDAEPGGQIDEVRMTAKALLPMEFLTLSPNYCEEELSADMNGDCRINLFDWVILANNWLRNTDPYKDR